MYIQTGGAATPLQSSQPLSDDQKQMLNEALTQYDATNLSNEDAKSLVSEISGLGISKGDALTTALTDAGFDPKDLADKAGLSRGEGPPPPATNGLESKGPDSDEVQALLSIVNDLRVKVEEGGAEGDFATLLSAALDEAGIDTTKPIVDFRA